MEARSLRNLPQFTMCVLSFVVTLSATAQTDAPRSYNAGGRTIHYKLTVFDPPIPVRPDPNRLNQDTAVNCTILFLTKLHDGDLEGAAAMTTDPPTTLKLYQAAKARLGEAEFSNKMAKLFNGDRYQFELVDGSEHLLVGEKHPDGAQAVVARDGKFWMDRQKFQHESQEFRDLFVLVNAHAAGKLAFK